MKTAVIYARYSCDNQTEQSIEGQLRVCQDYAQRNNILILGTYIDRAMTGTNDNRPDFQKMLKDSYQKEWDYVLVYKLDRFSRNKYEATIHKHTLLNNGVKVLSAMENIPDTPEGIILESLLEGMNQYYSAELAQKVKRGMYETRQKGNFTGGILPFGFQLKDKKVIIHEENAKIVNYIFNEYANDIPVPIIIDKLTAKGILYRNKPFKKNVIYNMLKNQKYTGVYEINNQIYTNMYPQIIDDNLFERVKKKTELNRIGSKSLQSVYLFRNKMKCGYCGMPISSDVSRNRYHTQYQYYKCLGVKKYNNGCKKETLPKKALEDLILNAIIETISNPKTIDIIVKNLIKIQNEYDSNNTFIDSLKRSQKQAQKSLQNLVVAVEQGLVTKTTGQRIKELETQIEELDKQIMIEENKIKTVLTENEIKQFYKTALKQEGLVLINYLVKEIILYNDKAEIIFNTPIKKSPNDKDSSFLSTNKTWYQQIQNKKELIIRYLQVDFLL